MGIKPKNKENVLDRERIGQAGASKGLLTPPQVDRYHLGSPNKWIGSSEEERGPLNP